MKPACAGLGSSARTAPVLPAVYVEFTLFRDAGGHMRAKVMPARLTIRAFTRGAAAARPGGTLILGGLLRLTVP
jgi:hypothetical protein